MEFVIGNLLNHSKYKNHIYYKLFGHSWGGRTKPLITDKYAMLDCCKPFVLNTETKQIEEWHI